MNKNNNFFGDYLDCFLKKKKKAIFFQIKGTRTVCY